MHNTSCQDSRVVLTPTQLPLAGTYLPVEDEVYIYVYSKYNEKYNFVIHIIPALKPQMGYGQINSSNESR